MNRKKFFLSASLAAAAVALFKYIPFTLAKRNFSSKKVEVKINPLAVSRKKVGEKNV
ncbi:MULTISPECIES: hypothetical protein [Ignavibacterium]|uniref:hypothetical protein n=1 Tax=Ignavibacterium TaxID=795750 RepID=UPI0025C14368|nr:MULTISPECIES: hypothetical protein [Ignavibacterium]MBI5660907.1 hypothetical protein [Ignavibacterium album]